MPETFCLPREFNAFVTAFAEQARKDGDALGVKSATNFWIMKPIGLSRGRGIQLINDVTAVSYADPVVVQKYVRRSCCCCCCCCYYEDYQYARGRLLRYYCSC